MTRTFTAWDLIGFDGSMASVPEPDGFPPPAWDADGDAVKYPSARVRIVGGRTLYEAVNYDDSRGGKLVRLGYLTTTGQGELKAIYRYVDPDTELELVVG